MQEPQTKVEMLQWVNDEWEALNELLACIPPAERERPGVEGGDWSIKDLMAHVTAWEKLMVQWLQEAARGETPQRPVPGLTWDDLDLLNQRIYYQNHDRPLVDVEADYYAFHQIALETVTPLVGRGALHGRPLRLDERPAALVRRRRQYVEPLPGAPRGAGNLVG